MRNALFLVVSLMFGMNSGALPTVAQDYPWCVQGKGVGYPGDCSYRTRAQCMASASGRDAGCGINPRVAFRRQQRGHDRQQ